MEPTLTPEKLEEMLREVSRVQKQKMKEMSLIMIEARIKSAKRLGATKQEILTAVCYGLGLVEEE